jgi:para-nitrobenzyl esterase
MPAVRLAEAAAGQGSTVHKYLFAHRSPALGGALGACHALELPFVFGTVDAPALRAFVGEGEAVRALSEAMQDAWLAFAREGRPRAAALGSWPSYEAPRRSTMRLDLESGLEDDPLAAERRFWDGIL